MAHRNKDVISVRDYESGDHDEVCKIFSRGILEHWSRAYRRTLTAQSPVTSLLQLLQLCLLCQLLGPGTQLLAAQLLVQLVVMAAFYHAYWHYTSHALATDMRDPGLEHWTGRGNLAGFYVATIQGRVVGTASYMVEVSTGGVCTVARWSCAQEAAGHLEMNRMSVDRDHRGLGVAGALLRRIEATAAQLGLARVQFSTSSAQEPAVALYTKHGYKVK